MRIVNNKKDFDSKLKRIGDYMKKAVDDFSFKMEDDVPI